jgi:hypothetical protein
MARGQTQWCDEARDHSPCSRSLPKAPLEAHQACLPVLRSATSSSPPAVVSPPIVYHVTYTQSVDVRPHTRPRGGGGERVMLHVARSQPQEGASSTGACPSHDTGVSEPAFYHLMGLYMAR